MAAGVIKVSWLRYVTWLNKYWIDNALRPDILFKHSCF